MAIIESLEARDKRPCKGSWAPGTYSRQCLECKALYLGDKRSWVCATCAYTPTQKDKEDE